MSFALWQAATNCTGEPTQGARALMAWALEAYPDATNMGIYNCRSVRGAATTSLHGEGRACDVGFPGARGNPNGEEMVRRLGENGKVLGIQAIIYTRKIYSAKSPEGREYEGLVPHWDHLHIELTREAANRLTLATFRSVLNSKPEVKPGGDDFMAFVNNQTDFNNALAAFFIAALDPNATGTIAVAGRKIRAAAWQQLFGRTDKSMHTMLGEIHANAILAAKDQVDEKALANALAPLVLPALQKAGASVTTEQFESALRNVLGSLNE